MVMSSTMLSQMTAAATAVAAAPAATGTPQFIRPLLRRKVPKVEYLLKIILTYHLNI